MGNWKLIFAVLTLVGCAAQPVQQPSTPSPEDIAQQNEVYRFYVHCYKAYHSTDSMCRMNKNGCRIAGDFEGQWVQCPSWHRIRNYFEELRQYNEAVIEGR